MTTIYFQPELRPELPLVDGPKEYRQQRALFVRLDNLLDHSGLQDEFFALSMAHRKIDLNFCSAAEVQSLSKNCTLALRGNLARLITGLNHRDFCTRLADSPLLQWFLQVGRIDGVSTFAKSTSDRFTHFIDAASLQRLNSKLIGMLQENGQCGFGLDNVLRFDAVYFDSTCLKAPIHHPVDWVLLRDANPHADESGGTYPQKRPRCSYAQSSITVFKRDEQLVHGDGCEVPNR